jgi:hypothetical protein
MKTLLPLAAATLLCWPALAGARVAPADDRLYAGLYSNACGDRSKPLVRLYDDVMSVEVAGKVVAAKSFRTSTAHLVAKQAADFKTAYIGDVKGGDGLVFVLTHNADGLFVLLEGGAKSLAMLGPGVQGQKLRHCDPNRNALPGAVVAQPMSPPQLLRDPRFKGSYFAALGPLGRERWLTTLTGPAPEVKPVKAGGAEYQLVSVCKPHDCAENNMVLLYGAAQGVVYGKVNLAGRSTLIGKPPPAMVSELERLWAQEWRAKR